MELHRFVTRRADHPKRLKADRKTRAHAVEEKAALSAASFEPGRLYPISVAGARGAVASRALSQCPVWRPADARLRRCASGRRGRRGPETPQPEPGRRAGPRNFGATIVPAEEASSVLGHVANGGFSHPAARPATGRFS